MSKPKKTKIEGVEGKPTIAYLDRLWSEAVKLRAGMRSEYNTKKRESLQSHHIWGKNSHRLRWELKNGICITSGEHKFIAHGSRERQVDFERWAMQVRGLTENDRLLWKHKSTKTVDLWAVKIHLQQEIEKYKRSDYVHPVTIRVGYF